jgi:predicted nuclease with RNAse H fold
MKALGLDLAGSPSRETGYAVIFRRSLRSGILHTDDEIIDMCCAEAPEIIAVDAPLSMPRSGSLRKADRLLMGMGLRVLPPTFGGMLSLTRRGIELSGMLRSRNFEVIEIHPRTSGMILFGTDERSVWLGRIKKMGFRLRVGKTAHEADACMAALTGYLHMKKLTEKIGDPEEGEIVIPLRRPSEGKCFLKAWRRRRL